MQQDSQYLKSPNLMTAGKFVDSLSWDDVLVTNWSLSGCKGEAILVGFGNGVFILSNLAVFATNFQDDVSESQTRPESRH